MVDRESETSVVRQCQLLGLKRGKVYHVKWTTNLGQPA